MSTPILATKLYIPPPRPKVVLRPRLIDRLNEGLSQNQGLGQSQGFGRKLTLISAPAGFGKTTLVSEWVNQKDEGGRQKGEKSGIQPSASSLHPSNVAWLSLDEGDNDLNHFLAYLVAALQTIAANLGEEVLKMLQAPPPLPTEPVLTALLNEITTVPDPFALVLDDYHLITAQPVDQALTFLLERLPPQIHLVIATREDPDLPLARLRVRGQLTELRAADLRFTSAEAAAFLNQMMSLNLSAEDIATLETRTEGWIAGLQLAAISMQGHQDAPSFIKSFTGSHRFVLDYLVEEVLQQQPESVQTFLLRTSILDRLCGPLCDAVCSGGIASSSKGTAVLGRGAEERGSRGEREKSPLPIAAAASGQETLEYLERANLLVVPLDEKRQWYRYHHLFADVLQARLMKEQPNQSPDLHQRACQWYAQNDLPSDAIRHALAAEDFERAADLIELAWSEIRRSCFRSPTWLGWVKTLPDELIRPRPVLSVGYAWELLNFGEMEAAETRMRDAERWLEPATGTNKPPEASSAKPVLEGMVVVNEAEFLSLRASLAIARGYHAQALGDVPGTAKYARRALALASEADYYTRGIAGALLGLAYWAKGDLETAQRSIADARTSLQMAGNILFALSTTFVLADIRIAQGRLHKAINTYKQALQLAAAQGEAVLQGTADLYLGLSELYHEQGEQESARQHLAKSEALGERVALPSWPYRLCLVQARIKQTQGDLDGVLDLLDEADRLHYADPVPNVHPIAALKTRVWVAQGKLNEALAWVHERGLSVDDELSYLREFEHVTLTRVLIARYRNDRVNSVIHQAMGLLKRLLKAAEAGERLGSVIEILVLQALAHEAQGDISAALAPLQQALTLAEPEGYIQIFVDEGLPMAELLTKLKAEGGRVNEYVHKLLVAFGQKENIQPSALSLQPLVEPLSDRELDVLRLLTTDLNGPEIARELMVSLNTMRTHTKNIYNKLGVNNRRAAVRRAEELDLL